MVINSDMVVKDSSKTVAPTRGGRSRSRGTWVVTLTRALGLFLGILGDNYANACTTRPSTRSGEDCLRYLCEFYALIGGLVFRCVLYGLSTLRPNHIP